MDLRAIVRLLRGIAICVAAQLGLAWAELGVSSIRRWAPWLPLYALLGSTFPLCMSVCVNVLGRFRGTAWPSAVALCLWAYGLMAAYSITIFSTFAETATRLV